MGMCCFFFYPHGGATFSPSLNSEKYPHGAIPIFAILAHMGIDIFRYPHGTIYHFCYTTPWESKFCAYYPIGLIFNLYLLTLLLLKY